MVKYALVCMRIDGSTVYEMSKCEITEADLEKIKYALTEINKLKLLFEVPYSLKINFASFSEYLNDKSKNEESYIWHLNNRILEANRIIFNLLSSINVIENYFKNILTAEEFTDYKKNVLGPYYDNSFNYQFLYKLRNYAFHKSVPITKLDFKFDTEEPMFSIFIDKNKILEDPTYFNSILLNKIKQLPESIDIASIIMNEIPVFLKLISDYIDKYYLKIKAHMDLIVSHQTNLKKVLKTTWNDGDLFFGIINDKEPTKMNNRFPSEFIKCFLEETVDKTISKTPIS